MKKVIYTEWGLANWYDDRIELNKNLKKYPYLHSKILVHENKHKSNFDLLHEINFDPVYLSHLVLFCIKHPKTWIDFSPIWFKENTLIYDKNKITLYLIGIFLIFILFKLF